MLKLNAQFSKKVPVPGQDYSSKGYSATIEVELPDGLTQEQLQERIHQTFALVEASVEAELNGNVPAVPVSTEVNQEPTQEVNKADPEVASPKQVKYLMDLARKGQVPLEGYLNNYGLEEVAELNRQQFRLFQRRRDQEAGCS